MVDSSSVAEKVFLRSKKKQGRAKKGMPVKYLFGHRGVQGQVGLEVEMEGNKFPKAPGLYPKGWNYTHDGSLRGQDNAEYVFDKPKMFNEVEPLLRQLWESLKDYGTVLDESNRTSVHVHLNVQDFHLNRLCSFMAIYICLEEILTQWCGDHRVGNLFCLRAKDAPSIVSVMKRYFQANGEDKSMFYDGLHYSGLNTGALGKFGSIEIRALQGVTDYKVIVQWVEVLRRIYELSAEYPDPRDFISRFSGTGPSQFFSEILGSLAHVVRQGCGFTEDEIRQSMYEGVRLAQELCYCRDWSEYEPHEPVLDPFGRDISQVLEDQAPSSSSSFASAYSPPQAENTIENYIASTAFFEEHIDAIFSANPPPTPASLWTQPVWQSFSPIDGPETTSD